MSMLQEVPGASENVVVGGVQVLIAALRKLLVQRMVRVVPLITIYALPPIRVACDWTV